MTPLQIIFLITSVGILGSALMVVTTRNLVHAALWLVVSLFGVAVLYVMLSAAFLAVAQVVIYIGAIAILMIFAIMLTRRVAKDSGPQTNPNWTWAVVVAAALFGGLTWLLSSWNGFSTPIPELSSRADPLSQLGQALVSPNAYVLPFEVASVLLLSALIGAIMVAWDRRSG
ncbi:MAG: NADH-quinone oxidoreductase subunit J [Anaerolineales bacterium]|nr:MAG: NADH-quinone oxidoreductase subunit J [Anaerolineales bacterium]